MPKEVPIELFLDSLKHARKAEILALRQMILKAEPRLTEHVKWNAPSYCFGGDDRITMRLQPKDQLQLIFHRGAKKKDSSTFAFQDTYALLQFAAPDRAVLTVVDAAFLQSNKKQIAHLVQHWCSATS